jgi:hypothetical protein
MVVIKNGRKEQMEMYFGPNEEETVNNSAGLDM